MYLHLNYRQSERTGSLTEGKAGSTRHANGHVSSGGENGKATSKFGKKASSLRSRLRETGSDDESDDGILQPPERLENVYDKASAAQKSLQRNGSHRHQPSSSGDSEPDHHSSKGGTKRVATRIRSKVVYNYRFGNLHFYCLYKGLLIFGCVALTGFGLKSQCNF